MKNKILKITLAVLAVGAAFGGWASIDRAVNVSAASNWLAPAIWFFCFYVFSCLLIILTGELHFLSAIFVLALLPGFFFAKTFGHLGAFFAGLLLFALAAGRIKSDIGQRLKINLWRSLRMGRMLLVLGLSLLIASQYYFETVRIPAQNIIPQFNLTDESGKLAAKIIGAFRPELEILRDEELTVDDFLRESFFGSSDRKTDEAEVDRKMDEIIEAELGSEVPEELKKEIRDEAKKEMNLKNENVLLAQGREQLAELAGRELSGSEKVSAVFSEIINNKINEFFQPGIGGAVESSSLPFIFALFVFLTVFSLGPFAASLAMAMTILIFMILVRARLVIINKVPTNKDVIEA